MPDDRIGKTERVQQRLERDNSDRDRDMDNSDKDSDDAGDDISASVIQEDAQMLQEVERGDKDDSKIVSEGEGKQREEMEQDSLGGGEMGEEIAVEVVADEEEVGNKESEQEDLFVSQP